MAGIAHRHRMGGDVLDHHGAGADHHVIADGDAGAYHDVTAEPDVVADGDGACSLRSGGAHRGVDWMVRRVQADAWSEEHAVADGDLRHVEEDAIHVGVEVVSDVGIAAVIAVERRFKETAVAH